MSKQREALEETLEILGSAYAPTDDYSQRVIALIEEALAEPARKPLTDEEIYEFADTSLYQGGKNFGVLQFARAIERAHGIGD